MKARSAHVIGSGPNGLTAAIVLARAGVRVTVYEAEASAGGGARSAPLTLPGFVHDVCSAVHPMAVSSPVFSTFPLSRFGLEWIHPPLPLAHPLDDGPAAFLSRSLEETVAAMHSDGALYRRIVAPFVKRWEELAPQILAPLHWPANPLLMARFGLLGALPAAAARFLFRPPTAALFAGLAAHSVLPLESPLSSAVAWVLAIAAHASGWPIPRGGSQSIATALAAYFESLGGEIVLNQRIDSLDDLPPRDLTLCDITPRQLLSLTTHQLPSAYRRKLESYRYGPGVFKMDWALNAPIPWTGVACTRAGTVHLGGGLPRIAEAERAPWQQRSPSSPFVLLAQPSLFDPTRAPPGKHVAWAYCHVPNASTEDMSTRIEAQIERFAPGFRQIILARHTMTPADLQSYNANLIGGDIGGGALTLPQLFLRPTGSLYRTPHAGLYLCSSSTPPGGGVHGMCGFHAATRALQDLANV